MSDVLSIHSPAWTPAAILAATISGAVGAATNTSYPDYSPLNYSLQDTYAGTTFFDNFDFFTNDDPTHRSVCVEGDYEQSTVRAHLCHRDSALIRVDTSDGIYEVASGRYSVRITSKKRYNSGLFVSTSFIRPTAVALGQRSGWPIPSTGHCMVSHHLLSCLFPRRTHRYCRRDRRTRIRKPRRHW